MVTKVNYGSKTKNAPDPHPCIRILDPLQDSVLQSQLPISHRPPSSLLSRYCGPMSWFSKTGASFLSLLFFVWLLLQAPRDVNFAFILCSVVVIYGLFYIFNFWCFVSLLVFLNMMNWWWSSNLRNGWSNQSNDPELRSKGTVKVRIRIDINPASLVLLLLFCLDELCINGLSLCLNSRTVDKSSIGVQQIRFLFFWRVKLFRLFHLFELSFILFDCINL